MFNDRDSGGSVVGVFFMVKGGIVRLISVGDRRGVCGGKKRV